MAEYTIVPLLNAQQLSTVNIAHMANIAPETSQALASQLAVNLLRQEAKQIQKTDKSAKSPVIGDEEGSDNSTDNPGLKKKRLTKTVEPNDENLEPSQPDHPLVGNLLNIKI